MKTIIFCTSNDRKIGEAKVACEKFDIEVQQVKLDTHEIQSLDPIAISKHKVEEAYLQIKKSVVVTDTYWNIPALKGFPGAYMKYVNGWFTSEDFLNLLKDKSDRRVSFTESITYKDKKEIKTFSREFWGNVIEKPRGSGNAIEQVAEFEGLTLGEHADKKSFSHKPEDYIWWEFAKWYSNKK